MHILGHRVVLLQPIEQDFDHKPRPSFPILLDGDMVCSGNLCHSTAFLSSLSGSSVLHSTHHILAFCATLSSVMGSSVVQGLAQSLLQHRNPSLKVFGIELSLLVVFEHKLLGNVV